MSGRFAKSRGALRSAARLAERGSRADDKAGEAAMEDRMKQAYF